MKIKKAKALLLKVLLIAIGMLYILFLYIDIFNVKILVSSNILKYISIILCFIIALLIGKDGFNRRDRSFLQIGLFITVLADFCFLILHNYILGIILFCLVQIIYFFRYKGTKIHRSTLTIFKFITIFLIVMTAYFIINLSLIKVDFLFAIAFFYALCLIASTRESIKAFKNNLYPYYNKHMIVVGMVLFLLCDINIAISNISKESNLLLHNTSALLIWTFYLPSQVLLSTSGYQFALSKKLNKF